ncbi:MAG: hypothetical protein JNN07_07710 [Verrucomicrobiales bacterium]|nr:hypothetical protein [Verrucomicrobiales bacterium]
MGGIGCCIALTITNGIAQTVDDRSPTTPLLAPAAASTDQIQHQDLRSNVLVPKPPITAGLIRYWHNLFDARDQVTGTEGTVRGVLPPPTPTLDQETIFERSTGWVELKPPITNAIHTISVWVHLNVPSALRWTLFSQEAGLANWRLFGETRNENDKLVLMISQLGKTEEPNPESFMLERGQWHHLAVAHLDDGTSRVWKNGERVLVGRVKRPWPSEASALLVGNSIRGNQPTHAAMRALGVYDRILTDTEIKLIHSFGVPPASVPGGSAARSQAMARPVSPKVSRLISTNRPHGWFYQRYTTEQGLPGNMVQALLQSREGYLWVGVEGGLARFDGMNFRSFDQRTTPALRITGDDILCLAEEKNGTLWAGTFGGLLRIRGAKPVRENSQSLVGSPAIDSHQTSATSLVGAIEITAFTNGLPELFIRHLLPADDGWLWMAGERNESPRGPFVARRYHPATGVSSGSVAVPGRVERMQATPEGLWIATAEPAQLLFWDGRAHSLTVAAKLSTGLWSDATGSPPSVHLSSAQCLPPETQLRIWISGDPITTWWAEVYADKGLPSFHWQSVPRSTLNATLTAGSSPSEIYLGGRSGLLRARGDQLESIAIPELPAAPNIVSLCQTREGGLWFGTEQDGLHLVQERLIRVFTTQDGLAANDIHTISVTEGTNLWVGSTLALQSWQPGRSSQAILPHHVACQTRTGDGTIWCVFSPSGESLGRVVSSNKVEMLITGLRFHPANTLLAGQDGRLWIAHENGLAWVWPECYVRTPGGKWQPKPEFEGRAAGQWSIGRELPDAQVVGIVEDKSGCIWIGSRGGGVTRLTVDKPDNNQKGIPPLDHPTGILKKETFTTADGLASDSSSPVLFDREGTLWVLGQASLSCYRNGRFQIVRSEQGFPDDSVSGAIEDGLGHVWLTGRKGIHRVSPSELRAFFDGKTPRISSLTLGVPEGLLTPECATARNPTLARTPDNHIWVATRNGLATFDPRRVDLQTQPLPIVIERLLVNKREFAFTAHNAVGSDVSAEPQSDGENLQFELPEGSGRQLEIHFAAICLTRLEGITFRYRLDGYDSEWSEPGHLRAAFYMNLKPGNYRFRVQGTRNRGQWSERESILDFTIAPYFWETRLFLGLVIVGIILAVLGLHWRRVVALSQQHDLQRREAMAAERVRIASDLHDDLGPTLTKIAILGESAKLQSPSGSPAVPTLDRIARNARELAASISDLNWATNPSYDSLENLAAYLREQVARQLEDSGVRMKLDFQESLPAMSLSSTFRRNIILMAKEAINNALRHSGASEIAVTLAVIDNRMLQLTIRDNGCGMTLLPSPGHSGNGTANLIRRAKELHGTTTIQSEPGSFTRVHVSVPLVAPD